MISMDFVKRVMMFHRFLSVLVIAYFFPRGLKACGIATILYILSGYLLIIIFILLGVNTL